MRIFLSLPVFVLLAACGMKGDLYETPPAEPTEPAADTATSETDKGERKTIPSTPDPAQSE